MKRILAAALAAMTALAAADAAGAQEFFFRWKDDRLAGVTGPGPEDPEPEVPSSCPDAEGIYAAASVTANELGCLYTFPSVQPLSVARMLPAVTAPSLDVWCGDVWEDSSEGGNGSTGFMGPAATWTELGWAEAGENAPKSAYVQCVNGTDLPPEEPEDPEQPHVPVDTLLNADFENRCSSDTCSWRRENSGFHGATQFTSVDRTVGGAMSISSYSWQDVNSVYWQDVDLPAELAERRFPVTWEWLQGTRRERGRGRVSVDFLGSGDQLLLRSQPLMTPVTLIGTWFERSAKAEAPLGTRKLRLRIEFEQGYAAVDNLVLKVEGIDYSTINGALGKPARGADFLRNASAELGGAHWLTLGTVPRTNPGDDAGDGPHDQFGRQGRIFSNYSYGETVSGYQQVWLGESQRQRQFRIEWLQSSFGSGALTADPLTRDDLVHVEFFTADGSPMAVAQGRPHLQVPRFWMHRSAEVAVPPGASFAIVHLKFKSPSGQYVDAITMHLDGIPKASTGVSGGYAMDYCPHYVPTVSGPDDRPWAGGLDQGNGLLDDDPVAYGYRRASYKSYCVPAGGGVLLSDYDIETEHVYAGLELTAYDVDGNQLVQKKSTAGAYRSMTDEHVKDAMQFPPETRYLRALFYRDANTYTDEFIYNHYRGVGWYVARMGNIDLRLGTLDDGMPPIAGYNDRLKNGSADLGTSWWKPLKGSKGFLEVHEQTMGLAESSRRSPPSSSARTSSVPCNDPCGPIVVNRAFKAVTGPAVYYQDVWIEPSAWGTAAELTWGQSLTGSGFTYWLDAFNSSANNATMTLEAWDAHGNVIASDTAASSTGIWFFSRNKAEITVPQGTWHLRAVMRFGDDERGLIDEIELRAGGRNLTADDQEKLQFQGDVLPEATRVINAGAEGDLAAWKTATGRPLSVRAASPAPSPAGGSGYFFLSGVPSGTYTYTQRIDITGGGHSANAPVVLEWLQASYEAKDHSTVNVRFFDRSYNALGGTDMPLETVSPAMSWKARKATLALPAFAAVMEVELTLRRDSGGNADGYLDNVRIRIDGVDYTDHDRPVLPSRAVNADAEGDLGAWTSNVEKKVFTSSPAPHPDGGTKYFLARGASASIYQDVDLTEGSHSAGDPVLVEWLQASRDLDRGAVNVTFYDGDGAVLGGTAAPVENIVPVQTWVQRSVDGTLPAGAARMRIEMQMVRAQGTDLDAYIDNIRVRVAGRDYTDWPNP